MSFKITINDEEVVSNSNLQIKEEMLSTSSTILKNCYPKSWEEDKDYISRYYFPKDYSKCKIFNETYYPEDPGTTVKGSNLNINYDNNKSWELKGIYGDTLQDGTPTPSSPVPIQNVTGLQNVNVCGKNLFDNNNITSGKRLYYWRGSAILIDDANYCVSDYINVNANSTYTINLTMSAYTRMIFYDNSKNPLSANETNATFTTPNNTAYVRLSVPLNQLDTTQLELGSTATSYEPYKGNTYEINLGKNLFDINGEFSSTSPMIKYNNGFQLIKNSGNRTLNYIPSNPIPKGTYTLSYDIVSSTLSDISKCIVQAINSSNTKIATKEFSNDGYITFTTTDDITKLYFYVSNSESDNVQITLDNVQLEKGSQVTSYSPYFTPIELNKIGNYQDRIYKDNGKWYVEKQTGKVVLDGNEAWTKASEGFYLSNTIFDNITNNNCLSKSTLYSNYYKNYTTSTTLMAEDYGIGIIYNVKNLYIRNNDISTANDFKTWLSTHNTIVYYQLITPEYTEITNEELISQLETIYQSQLYNGINNISVNSENLSSSLEIHYNFNEEYTIEDLIFCGCIKNTGRISLNPREPHYCDLQILDFKTLLSEGDCLNYVISNKTISEAINQVVSSISNYGFVVGNIQLLNPDEIIGAYSTLNKTAYDVFQYFADITQSRWTTRMIDENTIAIDFYDPTLMPQGTQIQSTTEFYENNDIVDISFNYSTNDYRNKQIMTSDEVFANITQTQTIIADGYTKNFMCENKIGLITNITLNGVEQSFITKNEEQLGYSGDFIYKPGENTFISTNTISAGGIIVITYYPIVKGREIILNSNESGRIETQIGRRGIISRYENRNDSTSSQELQKIGQSYIKYKGQAEITLKVVSTKDIWNIGQIVNYNAPLEELTTDYMVKSKSIDMYLNAGKIFYTYELTSNFNYENAVNYFDNQRAKNQGNIGEGETITRNIDLESTALIKFYDTAIEEIQVQNPTSLDFALDGVLI